MKTWYMMTVGYDIGGPESGPIIRCDREIFKAKSKDKARQRADKIYAEHYEGSEGYGLSTPTPEEVAEFMAECKEWALMMQDVPFN